MPDLIMTPSTPYDRRTDIPTVMGLAWNDVTVEFAGARLARRDEQRYARGAWTDGEGYAWPDGWHATWTMSGHDDGGTMLVRAGRCNIHRLAWLPVPHGIDVWDAHGGSPRSIAVGRDAMRRALLYVRDECEGI